MDQQKHRTKLRRRFEARFIAGNADACWPWTGRIDRLGYGVLDVFKASVNAHRLSFELFRHAIPTGQHVLHRCDNRVCVNPDHLFLGSHRDNMVDMARKNRAQKKLSLADVAAIRAANDGQQLLAKRFAVDPSTICKIKSHQRRPHV